jgi:hypothetical protein
MPGKRGGATLSFAVPEGLADEEDETERLPPVFERAGELVSDDGR